MIPRPKALPSLLPSELLTYLLQHQKCSTTLVICQKREDFINSLVSEISSVPQKQKPPECASCDKPETCTAPNSSELETTLKEDFQTRNQLLLIPTLDQLVISRHIHVVFVPTVSHLRAYLANFPPPLPPSEPDFFEDSENPSEATDKIPFLFVYGLLDLHQDTCEWSARGLCNTLAGLIQAGLRSSNRVVTVEKCHSNVALNNSDVSNSDTSATSRRSAWITRVPILHTSAGLHHEEQQPWSGRTTEFGRILARWFSFGVYN